MDENELQRRYTHYAPDEKTRHLHDMVRQMELAYATSINDLPGHDSREKSTALTKLEEAMFWAHAHIARNLHRQEG